MSPIMARRLLHNAIQIEDDDDDDAVEERDSSLTRKLFEMDDERVQSPSNPRSRLFGDDDDSCAVGRMSKLNMDGTPSAKRGHHRHASGSGTLLNFGESASTPKQRLHNIDDDTSTLDDSGFLSPPVPPPSINRRKRSGFRQPAGREEVHHESEEDESMFSPKTLSTTNAVSNNPFSSPHPVVRDKVPSSIPVCIEAPLPFDSFETASFGSVNTAESMDVSSFSSVGTHKIGTTARRNNNFSSAAAVGFPDRRGRYSFTGSPIEEIDLDKKTPDRMGMKVRRLNREISFEDASKDLAPPMKGRLFVDTDNANRNSTAVIDEISPTDVMAFPSPVFTKNDVSTGTASAERNAPPETPVLERRNRVARRRSNEREFTEARRRGSNERESFFDATESAPPRSRFNEDFELISTLGDGSFGTVYKCMSKVDGCMYAVKTAKRAAKGFNDRDRMLKEVYALAAICDQADTAAFHILRYHQAWMEENRLYIQTELCTSTLEREMARGPLTDERKFQVLREILLALELLHRNNMVHLDIKPENIFLKSDQFKLGDFGLVSKITNHKDVEEGDSRYMSMELLSGDLSDLTKCDIFSLGATVYELCLGRQLPADGQEWQDIRAGELQKPPTTPYSLFMIISEMMNPVPVNRPSAAALLKRGPLLSEERKMLLVEKTKVLEAKRALATQQEQMKITIPPKRALMRANTWNGGAR